MRTGEIGRERGRRGDRESKMRISSIYPHRLHTALKAGTYRWHWATYGCLLKPLISLSLCTAPSVTCLRHPWVCASFTILSDSSTHAHTRTHTHKRTYVYSVNAQALCDTILRSDRRFSSAAVSAILHIAVWNLVFFRLLFTTHTEPGDSRFCDSL